MLTKNSSARVEIQLRSSSSSIFSSGPSGAGAGASASAKAVSIPLETFATNKDMGRILLRRNGETIGAGKYSAASLRPLLQS